MNKRIDLVSSQVEEGIPKIGQPYFPDHDTIRSEIAEITENNNKEIERRLNGEIKTLSKTIETVSLQVEKTVPKIEQLSSFDHDKFRSDMMKVIENRNKEITRDFKNEMNGVEKRLDTVSSQVEQSIPEIKKLASVDSEKIKNGMLKTIEDKTEETAKGLKTHLTIMEKRIEKVSSKVEDSIPKMEKVITVDPDAIKADVIKIIERKTQEMTKDLKSDIRSESKRVDTLSSKMEEFIPQIEKQSSFDSEKLKTEMIKAIESKGKEITKDFKNDIDILTQNLRCQEDKAFAFDQRFKGLPKSIDDLNDETKNLSK